MQQLIKEAINGNAGAWSSLYRHHHPWMYATALRICGNCPAAKDVVQEAFITAYLNLSQLKDCAAFPAWLKAILVRLCHRNSQSKSVVVAIDAVRVREDGGLSDDEIGRKMDEYERLSKVHKGVARLSDTLQSVLLLRYFSDSSSYEEMAAILCIPIGTVRSRLNQVKQKLTEYWAIDDDNNDLAFRNATEWNNLYDAYFSNVYTSLHYREKLIDHFDKNLLLVCTSGKTTMGRHAVQQLIEEDIEYGNSFAGLQVSSSGNLSVIESGNINSDICPDHCPAQTVFLLYRTGNRVTQMNLHHSAREMAGSR